MQLSPTEENYLKCIAYLSGSDKETVSTNSIAAQMKTSAASTTDMLKKLSEKKLIHYKKYQGVSLSESGMHKAHLLIRKHRLWEVFLLEKLGFQWDEVHEMAEQLEHIQSDELIARLDKFLSYPKFDPHGDPIPDRFGNMENKDGRLLSQLLPGTVASVIGVKDSDNKLLQYLSKIHIGLGSQIELKERNDYDQSISVVIDRNWKEQLSEQVANNIFVRLE